MLTLDTSTGISLEYLAEGAANIVYKIIPPPPSPITAADLSLGEEYDHPPTEIEFPRMNPALENKLVRLRKNNPSTASVLESHRNFEKNIAPLFPPENLVEQILFKPTRALLRQCNNELRDMETIGRRSTKRHKMYLAEDEPYGTLVSDMSCASPETAAYRAFEFKPKWLVQSPSAPGWARRCRTCALRHMKGAQEKKGDDGLSKTAFCPLGLVSTHKATIAGTVENITGLKECEAMRNQIVDFLHWNALLNRLRELQAHLDRDGVLEKDPSSPNLLAAMTLRDCTLFLKVPSSGGGTIEARLGDLDFKSPDKGKREYWQNLERRLIEDGWYFDKKGADGEDDKLCMLAEGKVG